MSELFFRCPLCSQEIEAPDDLAGTMINCPSCDRLLRVPGDPPPGAYADMVFQCPECGHGIDIPAGTAGLHLACPMCGKKIPVPSPKPLDPVAPIEPADPAPTEPVYSEPPPVDPVKSGAPFNGDPMHSPGLEEEKKGATTRIDLPEGDSAPSPQMRTVTIKRASGTQTGNVPRQIAGANQALTAKKSGRSGIFGLFGRRG